MKRKPPGRAWMGGGTRDVSEYRSDPSTLAQSYWYYVLCLGTARYREAFTHSHRDEPGFLLHFVRRGSVWHVVMNREHRAQAGSVCLMSLEKPVRYGNVPGPTTEVWWALFGGRDLPDMLRRLDADRAPIFPLPDVRRFERLFKELLDLTRRRPVAYQAKSFGVLALMLGELFASRGSRDERELDLVNPPEKWALLSEPVLNAIRRIGRFYNGPMDLRFICATTNLSMYHFVRLFHREVGMSPVRYLARYRIAKAKELLRTTNHPIGEVARMVGMPNPYTFSRTFRRVVGCTASACRGDEAARGVQQ